MKSTNLSSGGLPSWLSGKESACQCRRCRFDPLVGKTPGGGNGNPLQYSCLEKPMDRRAWWAISHRVRKSQTQLSTHTPLGTVFNLLLKKFFLMWTILKVFIKLVTILLFSFCCYCFMFWFYDCEACEILALWPRMEPIPPALEGKVLTTGPSGKSFKDSL